MIKTDGLEHEKADLLASWRQTFGRWYLSVYIWRDVEALYRATGLYWQDKNYLACYRSIPIRNYPIKQTSGQYGQLHFNANNIGSGIVAHEIRHFDWDYVLWKYDNKNITKKRMERMCYLIGDITRSFWNTFNDKFKEKETNPLD